MLPGVLADVCELAPDLLENVDDEYDQFEEPLLLEDAVLAELKRLLPDAE